jgi:toxin-antitoxin system PIN domain toxin
VATGKRRIALLDVNVLVALAWPNHAHHRQAHRWFSRRIAGGWATTPITESGFVRVSSNRAALPTATTPQTARELLRTMTKFRGHTLWADDLPLVIGNQPAVALPGTHRSVTDAHLLALAARHDGFLATFDTGIERLLGELPADTLQILDPAGDG